MIYMFDYDLFDGSDRYSLQGGAVAINTTISNINTTTTTTIYTTTTTNNNNNNMHEVASHPCICKYYQYAIVVVALAAT